MLFIEVFHLSFLGKALCYILVFLKKSSYITWRIMTKYGHNCEIKAANAGGVDVFCRGTWLWPC
jgi:hypothetical protein